MTFFMITFLMIGTLCCSQECLDRFAPIETFFCKSKMCATISKKLDISSKELLGLEKTLAKCRQEFERMSSKFGKISFCAIWYNNLRSVGGFVVVVDNMALIGLDVSDNEQSNGKTAKIQLGTKESALVEIASIATDNWPSKNWEDEITLDGSVYFCYFNTNTVQQHSFIVPDFDNEIDNVSVSEGEVVIAKKDKLIRGHLSRLLRSLVALADTSSYCKQLF